MLTMNGVHMHRRKKIAYFKYRQTASTLKSLIIYDRWNFSERKMHVKWNSARGLICLFIFTWIVFSPSAGVSYHFGSGVVYIFIYTNTLVNGYVTISYYCFNIDQYFRGLGVLENKKIIPALNRIAKMKHYLDKEVSDPWTWIWTLEKYEDHTSHVP